MWRSILVLATVLGRSIALVSPVFETIQNAQVLNSKTGEPSTILSSSSDNKSLVVILPQLGEFDSSEFCEYLVAVQDNLQQAGIGLQVVGIGNPGSASAFCEFTGLDAQNLWIDPDANLHKALQLNQGPNWDLPESVSDDFLKFALNQLPGGAPSSQDLLRPTARGWLNYLAMCAGIGAPGTLPEILRGYFGDASAPERFQEDDVVNAGFVTIGPGVGPVKLGPLNYNQWWQDERGYQRPVELATVRLKNMVEVLTKWDTYVSNPTTIDQRGATYLLDNKSGQVLYEYKHKGVLTYSETMPRPLTFLAPYIGEDVAKNPLGLLDYDEASIKQNSKGRGILKPAGKFMSLLGPLFALENKLQAKALGVQDADLEAAKQEIQSTIENNKVVVYTYGLSPFSSQTMALLRDAGYSTDNVVKQIEIGLEWFLLGKEASATRAALLDMTGQSSLPHIFVNGQHIGGIFSGTPGLAALQESGKLQEMLQEEEEEEKTVV